MPIYMEVPGAEGSVTEAGKFDSWIPLTGYQHSVDCGIAMEKASKKTIAGGAPRLSTFTVMKNFEDSSLLLLQKTFDGLGPMKVKIALTSEKETREYLLYELTDAYITSYDVSSSGEQPFEVIEFVYSQFNAIYTPYEKGHKADSKVAATYVLGGE